MRSRKAATSPPGWGSSPSRSRPATAPSSARFRNAAIATCAFYSFRPRGSYLSSRRAGTVTGSSLGSKRPRSGCITTSSPSRSPISSLALLGASWLAAEHSRRARFRSRDQRVVETSYLPRSARGLETRWRIGLPPTSCSEAFATLRQPWQNRQPPQQVLRYPFRNRSLVPGNVRGYYLGDTLGDES